jgi:hypothetical protein
VFSKGRDFAAWLGLVPRQISIRAWRSALFTRSPAATMARSTARGLHLSLQESPHARGARSCRVSHAKNLFAPTIAQAGLLPDRVIYVDASDEPSVLACFEERLRHGGLSAVVVEVATLSMTASRRLQLVAEGSGAIGIAIRRWRRQTEAAEFGHPTAAVARWRLGLIR